MMETGAPQTRPKGRRPVAPEVWLAGAAASPGQPLSQQIYGHMRRAIIEGRLEPGGTIDEPAVAHHFGVSRTPVREALLRLRQDGLVEIRRQAGTFVAPIDRTRVEEGMIVREALEPRALEIACARTDQRTLDDLVALT
ncbi:MAG: GntR family transcriptional regulator, partial [Pseudomonadota bacterium]